jgi:hypothetical protein
VLHPIQISFIIGKKQKAIPCLKVGIDLIAGLLGVKTRLVPHHQMIKRSGKRCILFDFVDI